MKNYIGYFTNKPNICARIKAKTIRNAARQFADGHEIKAIRILNIEDTVATFKTWKRGTFKIEFATDLN